MESALTYPDPSLPLIPPPPTSVLHTRQEPPLQFTLSPTLEGDMPVCMHQVPHSVLAGCAHCSFLQLPVLPLPPPHLLLSPCPCSSSVASSDQSSPPYLTSPLALPVHSPHHTTVAAGPPPATAVPPLPIRSPLASRHPLRPIQIYLQVHQLRMLLCSGAPSQPLCPPHLTSPLTPHLNLAPPLL
jgi:hypothetical protein